MLVNEYKVTLNLENKTLDLGVVGFFQGKELCWIDVFCDGERFVLTNEEEDSLWEKITGGKVNPIWRLT